MINNYESDQIIKTYSLNEKKKLIEKYNLKFSQVIKKFTINNVIIYFYKDKHIFTKEKKNDYIENINAFNFYKCQKEEIYNEYVNSSKNSKIKLEEYNNYLLIKIN